jgi:transposase
LASIQLLFQEIRSMASASRSRKRRSGRRHLIHKPRGVIHPRVQAVGPERFGIVSVDCAKARSKWMLADFYGKVLVPPTVVEHTKSGLEGMVCAVKKAKLEFGLLDMIVAVERTGRYHHPIKRAFRRAGFDTRVVHPLTSKQFRQSADPGNKTDDTDLNAIHRATVNGFGLIEQPLDAVSARLQLLERHRRDLVDKKTVLRCQIQEHLQAIMPGYAKCFDDIFDAKIPLEVAKHFGSADAVLQAGFAGLTQHIRQAGLRTHRPTLEKVLAWARIAAPATEEATIHHSIMKDLEADYAVKLRAAKAVEAELVELLVQTPYVLLLGVPGINVVSAADFAGEMGPIGYYPHARAITGRAGLFPSRYQSDEVDYPNGKLIRCANRRLRDAIMRIADNLIEFNDHFRVLAAQWQLQGKDPRSIRVRVAGRFCRIAYWMVAQRTTYHHPSCRQRDYILSKLIKFSLEHDIDIARLMKHLDAAAAQLPSAGRVEEGAALVAELNQLQNKRGSGPRLLAQILPAVLAKLGVQLITSTKSGEVDSK